MKLNKTQKAHTHMPPQKISNGNGNAKPQARTEGKIANAKRHGTEKREEAKRKEKTRKPAIQITIQVQYGTVQV